MTEKKFEKKYNLIDANDTLLKEKLPRFDIKNPPEGVDPVELGKELLAHMRYFGGIGLSANQLGLPYRVFVMEGDPGFVCFNPTITAYAGELVNLDEGCLSYPGLYVKKKRRGLIRVRFQDPYGNWITRQFAGMSARVFLHEYDHLFGVDFTDKVSKLKLDMAKKKVKNNGHRSKNT